MVITFISRARARARVTATIGRPFRGAAGRKQRMLVKVRLASDGRKPAAAERSGEYVY